MSNSSGKKLVVGVDSSTQSVKVVVREIESGKLVRESRSSHPDGTEVDPEAWWTALQQALTDAGVPGDENIVAISIGGQQHGMVLLDVHGKVIRPALLWNDTRSADAANALNQEVPDVIERTGLKMVASFTASKVRWVADHEARESLDRVKAICLPHDYLSWRLACEGFITAASSSASRDLSLLWTDRSDASGTGYFNPRTEQYDLALLACAMRVTESELKERDIVLPRIVPPHCFGGVVAGTSIGIGAGAGDNAAAAFGLHASPARGDVVVSLGTSGTAFLVSPSPVLPTSDGVVAGFAAITPTEFLPLVCTLNCARVLDAVVALLGLSSHAALDELVLRSRPGALGLTLLPYFEGERTPNRPDSSGVLVGLTVANHKPEHLARAYVEGVLCSLADAVHELLRSTGRAEEGVKRVILIGGAAKSPAVAQVAATLFGEGVEVIVPHTVGAEGEFVANGAARQAAWAYTGGESPPDWSKSNSDGDDKSKVFIGEYHPEILKRYLYLKEQTALWDFNGLK